MADPLPMLTLFDKLIQLRMGQANSSTGRRHHAPADRRRPARVEGFATHKLALERAPWACETFPKKEDDAIKIVFEP